MRSTAVAIVVTKHFYHPEPDKTSVWRICPSRAEARAIIAGWDRQVYYTAHNEQSRPSYRIVPVNRLSKRLRYAGGFDVLDLTCVKGEAHHVSKYTSATPILGRE